MDESAAPVVPDVSPEGDQSAISGASSQQDPSSNHDVASLFPLARDHSYLPGTSHPLHIESSSFAAPNDEDTKRPARTHRISELPVLELPGVVLFPGSTFPLRFSRQNNNNINTNNSAVWMDYLARQIQASRAAPGQSAPIRFGILTAKIPVTTRRQSWTRQSFGPVRLRRLSQQLIQELGEDFSSDDDDDDDSNGYQESAANREALFRESDVSRPIDIDIVGQYERGSSDSMADSSTALRDTRERVGFGERIGTIVTVVNTHGDEADAALASSTGSHVWRSLEQGVELVITTVATGRFRIIGYADSENAREMYGNQGFLRFPQHVVSKFKVEDLDDSPMPVYPFSRLSARRTRRDTCADRSRESECDRIVCGLSAVSAIPKFVIHKYLPSSLVSLIKGSMAKSRAFAGFLELLQSNDTSTTTGNNWDNATQISFWLASNLPFSLTEKLRLLEMHSTVERLRFIYHKVVREERSEPLIVCKKCSIPLSRAMHMFTVRGAEGTTGAYVNSHGVVHQTITMRHLREDDVLYTGGAETQDSWFPGYSWTIMSCSLCLLHLGWKFVRVPCSERPLSNPPPVDRPDVFFGLSAGSVSTVLASRREK
jgi:hypothetical protein